MVKKKKSRKDKTIIDRCLDRLAEILKKQPPGTAEKLLDEAIKEEEEKKDAN
ncbi:MAG: hypothetical protein AB1403_11360 [Candidatus Riflebacteria bacterium]